MKKEKGKTEKPPKTKFLGAFYIENSFLYQFNVMEYFFTFLD